MVPHLRLLLLRKTCSPYSGCCMLLAEPAQVRHWFANDDMRELGLPDADKCAVRSLPCTVIILQGIYCLAVVSPDCLLGEVAGQELNVSPLKARYATR